MDPKTNVPLKVDLRGRVRNMRLAPSNALFALYEAVVNSIHAILDGPNPQKGKINIMILRAPSQQQINGKSELGAVVGFQIHDNGVGFDDKNFDSFCYCDSTTKVKYGGKGVGRLLWLKVFSSVSIESVFKSGNLLRKRKFTFSTDGISNPETIESDKELGTIVTIKSPVEYYRSALQHEAETIAISTIEHCLEYFISDKTPQIYLSDPDAGYDAELGNLFLNDLKSEIKRDNISINGSKFCVTHLLMKGRKNSRHALHFCAHSRRVKDESLTGKIAGLAGGLRLPGSTEDLAYQGYVSGEVLNQLVDVERASFDFDGLFTYDPNKPPEGTVSFDILLNRVLEKTKIFLEPILKPILDANQARIRSQIETIYPQYRYLWSAPQTWFQMI